MLQYMEKCHKNRVPPVPFPKGVRGILTYPNFPPHLWPKTLQEIERYCNENFIFEDRSELQGKFYIFPTRISYDI